MVKEKIKAYKKTKVWISLFFLILVLVAGLILFLATRPQNIQPAARMRTALEQSENADAFLLRYEFGVGKTLEYIVSITKKAISDETLLLDIVVNQRDEADFSAESLRGKLHSSPETVISPIFVGGGSGNYTVPEVSYPDGKRVHRFRTDGYLHLTALVNGSEVSLELSVAARENAFFFPKYCVVTESFSVLG